MLTLLFLPGADWAEPPCPEMLVDRMMEAEGVVRMEVDAVHVEARRDPIDDDYLWERPSPLIARKLRRIELEAVVVVEPGSFDWPFNNWLVGPLLVLDADGRPVILGHKVQGGQHVLDYSVDRDLWDQALHRFPLWAVRHDHAVYEARFTSYDPIHVFRYDDAPQPTR